MWRRKIEVFVNSSPKENVGMSDHHHPTDLEEEVRAVRQEIRELKELLKAVHKS